MKFLSCARWPKGTFPCNNDLTRDTHDTREQAQGVCNLLCRRGAGGDGKVFPLATWVAEAGSPSAGPIMEQLPELHHQLFDLANSVAGNERGNAAVYLHEAANNVNRATRCLERGNPADEPIPGFAIASAL